MPRLEAENLLPQPRLNILMPRLELIALASVSSLLPRPDFMLRHRHSEPLGFVIYLR